MKRYLLIIAAASVCLLSACKSKDSGGMSEKAKKNLEAHHAVSKMFETGDFSKLGDYIATDAIDHTGMKGEVIGLDSIKAAFAMYMSMMSDMKSETVKELADDDYTFEWVKQTWVAKVDDMGMKAGDKGNMEAIEVTKFKDGKASDHWTFISYTDMVKMMGGQQPPKEDDKTNQPDTTHK